MAQTAYGTNAPEAVKLWSKALAQEALKATYIGKFIGKSDDSLIQEKTETKKDAGDRVRITLRMQLSGDGVQGDGTLEGNEEALTTYTDDLIIDQLRHAVRSAGKMSEQRIPWSVREEAMAGLRDWWADRFDTWYFNQVCGYTPQTNTKYTGNQAVLAPTAFQRAAAAASDQALTSSNTFDLGILDNAVAQAKTASPMMRPVKVGGKDHYVCFLHPYQVRDLRKNTANGQWLDIQKAALQGGSGQDNPIFTGALGVYNGVVLHESARVTQGVNGSTGAAITTVRRAVLCGAQSAAIAFGKGNSFEGFSWVEELFDYENQLGVSAGNVAGLKKLQFNSADFSTIVLSSYAA
jgi:N4-gp56 family major capsid protein